jgi:hypothetical protein
VGVHFLSIFGTDNPCSRVMISYTDVNDAMHMRRTCRNMYGVVGSCLTEKMVEGLTNRVRRLALGSPFSLKNAPESCKNDRCFVACAVRRNGLNYLFASQDVQKDLLIVKTAIVSAKTFNPSAVKALLRSIEPKISSRLDLCTSDVAALMDPPIFEGERDLWVKNGSATLINQHPLNRDKTAILSAVYFCGEAFEYALPELRADRKFVLAVVEQNGLALRFALPEFRADKEIVMAAVCSERRALVEGQIARTHGFQKSQVLKYASHDLQADKDIIAAAVRPNVWSFEYMRERFAQMVSNYEVRRPFFPCHAF